MKYVIGIKNLQPLVTQFASEVTQNEQQNTNQALNLHKLFTWSHFGLYFYEKKF